MDKNFVKAMAKSQAGFSLLEILIGLALVALLGGVVATKVMDSFDEGKVSAAVIQMQGFDKALKDFRRNCNFYPTTEQGLEALLEKPTSGRECKRYRPNGYLDATEVPLDPWENEYLYESDGKKFNIISYGADGEEGGEGFNADVPLNEDKSKSSEAEG